MRIILIIAFLFSAGIHGICQQYEESIETYRDLKQKGLYEGTRVPLHSEEDLKD